MDTNQIPFNTPVFQIGKQLQPSAGQVEQWLYIIAKQLTLLRGALYNIYTSTPVAFTVGTTTGAPVNGQSVWTMSTINTIGKNPVFLLNGVPLVQGTDYTFNNSTGTLTLLTTTFATSQVYTVIY